jgi:hypothetical protein|tara:strand:+ start:2986 stop:3333 length:348 start_codon:yes stop_codon:yes gene_type:complete
MDRGFEIKDMLVGNESPDEIMDLIRDTFESVLVPEVGGYYTFVYSPKTPDLQYDQYPLVAVTELFSWGFRGINYHWGDYRNYGWGEVGANSFHQISDMEIKSVRSLPFAKYLLNN